MGAASYPGAIAAKLTDSSREVRFKAVIFGEFELRTETGELWKNGVRKRLQQKPLQILQALLDKPGELVTRDELCQRLWPDGTFVDFESGLNTAVNRLRSALGDSPERPQFIETLPRLGYRFICPVTGNSIEPEAGALPVSELKCDDSFLEQANTRDFYKLGKATLLSAAVIAVFALPYLHSKQQINVIQPSFHQLTFRIGKVASARFIPSSEKLAYTAQWQDRAWRTYLLDLRDLGSQGLNIPSGILASVSKEGDYGVISRDPAQHAEVSFSSFSHQDGRRSVISKATSAADWLPQSHDAAIVRLQSAESVVEFPSGHVVYSSRGWITNLRVSPHSDQVAFLEHPVHDDDGGYVRVVDKKGNTNVWTPLWSSAAGLAWSQSGNEVWFTASKEGTDRALYAASGPGKLRLISQSPSSLRILDVSERGQALVALDDTRMDLRVALPGQAAELDLSKFDCSHVDDISPDGRFILFTESSGGVGKHYTSYIHDLNSHATIRLAQGRGLALSPDARWALTIDPQDRHTLVLNHREGGPARRIYGGGFEYQWAKFLPDTREFLVGGAYPGEPLMIGKQALTGGKPKPIEGVSYMDYVAVSLNGTEIAGVLNNQLAVFDLTEKPVRKALPDLGAMPVAWSEDGHHLYAARIGGATTELVSLALDTGQVEPWKTIPASESPEFAGLASVVAAPQAGTYAYSRHLNLSRLYLVDGWG
ncbi:MAG: winged helix-turn-helix domain-containing protein [Acidobacteriaceae bacterium]|nr:winged helix-turn-helix domain-containing protein [Acidobacteriaceae bacterium]